MNAQTEGILILNKPVGKTSFSLVSALRRALNVKKIGHAGTLDPFASGVMVMLIGKNYTTKSDTFLTQDKEYLAEVHLGQATDTFDTEGKITYESALIPSQSDIEALLTDFQGTIEQIPPMFSAKKVGGKKLYELARKGKEVPRAPISVTVSIDLLTYDYPKLTLRIKCSKGTYIRTLAHDLGTKLGCGGHLTALQRTRSGAFHLSDSYPKDIFTISKEEMEQLKNHLIK